MQYKFLHIQMVVCSVSLLVTEVVYISFDRCIPTYIHITALLCRLLTTVGELQIVDNGLI